MNIRCNKTLFTSCRRLSAVRLASQGPLRVHRSPKKEGCNLFFVYTIRIMFEWDADKAAANLAKHGVAFERVHEFDWNTAQINMDDREDYGELRMIALGFIGWQIFHGQPEVDAFDVRQEGDAHSVNR